MKALLPHCFLEVSRVSNRGKELARLTSEAVKSVSRFVTRKGPDDFDIRIDWPKISLDKMAALDAGPGRVNELVEQDPIHLQTFSTLRARYVETSDHQFIRDASGFSILFLPAGNFIADASRQHGHMRRFLILFPELESAVRVVVAERAERRKQGNLQDYPFYAGFMRFVYALLSQLVDGNDICYDRPVRDSASRRNMLKC